MSDDTKQKPAPPFTPPPKKPRKRLSESAKRYIASQSIDETLPHQVKPKRQRKPSVPKPIKGRRASAREFSASDLYNKLIEILHISETNQQSADRLGISTRTLRRWKSEGIPAPRTEKQKQTHKKISTVYSNITRQQKRQEQKQKPPTEKRIIYYDRFYGKAKVRHFPVENMPYEAIRELLLKECLKQPRTVSYNFLLKLSSPFSGIFDGEEFTSEKKLASISKSDAKAIRNNGSWLDIAKNDPFVNTRLFAYTDMCDISEIDSVIDMFFGKPYITIYEIRSKYRRPYDEDIDG